MPNTNSRLANDVDIAEYGNRGKEQCQTIEKQPRGVHFAAIFLLSLVQAVLPSDWKSCKD
jgi:hypothetical protein